MRWEDWIDVDNEWPSFHQQKLDRIAERGDRLVMVHKMANDAAQETLELVSKYLTKRYPTMFRYVDEREEFIQLLETGEIYPIVKSDSPMKYAALLVQDDLAIMMEGPDGIYYLRAGAICLAGFWRLEDKFGMSLEEIHTSGDGNTLQITLMSSPPIQGKVKPVSFALLSASKAKQSCREKQLFHPDRRRISMVC
jgi:hypothetical protein